MLPVGDDKNPLGTFAGALAFEVSRLSRRRQMQPIVGDPRVTRPAHKPVARTRDGDETRQSITTGRRVILHENDHQPIEPQPLVSPFAPRALGRCSIYQIASTAAPSLTRVRRNRPKRPFNSRLPRRQRRVCFEITRCPSSTHLSKS